MKEISLFELRSDVNIGLYTKRIGDKLLCGIELTSEARSTVERVLGLEVVQVTVAGTPYPGIFLLDAGDRIIAPHIMYESERETLHNAGFDVEIWTTFDTALANSICIDGKRAIISKAAHASLGQALEGSGFDVLQLSTGAFEAAGSLIVPGAEKVLVGGELDAKAIGKFLEKEVVPASVNRGSPFLVSGIIASEKGILIGRESLPLEVMTITEVL